MQKKEKNEDKKRLPRNFYVLLGCGSLGFAVAKRLRDSHHQFFIIDKNAEKVKSLQETDFEAFQADISSPQVIDILEKYRVKGALILSPDKAANKAALEMIKEYDPKILTIYRISDPAEEEEPADVKPDLFINPLSILADEILEKLMNSERQSKTKEFLEFINRYEKGEKIGIVIQDTPDPDGIASAMALSYILQQHDINSDIIFSGGLGHQANKAMVNLLNIRMINYSEEIIKKYSHFALVDVGVPSENNSLPSGTHVDIIIDHHKTNEQKLKADFIDLRPDVGANATILTDYLMEMGFEIDVRLATALLYGIRSDTDEFRRNAGPLDLKAASALYALADKNLLRQIQSPAKTQDTVDVLGDAIKNKVVKGNCLVSNAGLIHDKDSLAQAADYLITMEGINTALVFGITHDKIYISARNTDVRTNIGAVLVDAFDDVGSSGGHRTMAGAQIPLGVFSDTKDKETLYKLVEEAVKNRFFEALGRTVD